MVVRKSNPRKFFTREERDRIARAIRKAESKSSAEICVYLERRHRGETLNRAQKVFEKLGMTKTRLRNGVLIYFSLKDHSFAILGDQGIHEKVGGDFWKDGAAEMQASFSRDDFAGGIELAIQKIGGKLVQYFPREARDINELPDTLR